MKYVMDREWLIENLHDPKVRMVDCRFSLLEPEKGSREYREGHLPGAVFFDLEKDLSGAAGLHGGRHPLPNMEKFIHKLEKAGLDENCMIVAYDSGEGAFAARFWWMLCYLGHENVYVLDGGYKAWVSDHYPITTEIPSFEKSQFQVAVNPSLIASIEEVKEAVRNESENVLLVDSREEKRYLGIEEPIDKKAGRIPGAINKPWMEGMRNGQYKQVDEQKQRFSEIDPEKELIVYCGSGVTAVPNFLALKEAGFEKVRLYVGSFSDWISYGENEIE